MLLLRHQQPQRQLALRARDGSRSSLPALASRLQRRAGADSLAASPAPWASSSGGSIGSARGLAGGFFDQLRQSFKQEVEKNKEFKESLSKLKKETGDLTGKAQESTSKLQESLGKYTEGITSKLSETTETLAKSTQAIKDQMAQLKEKAAASAAAAKEEKEKQQQEAAAVAATAKARAATAAAEEEEKEPPVAKASASTSTAREEEKQQEETAQEAKASASGAEAGQQQEEGGAKQEAGACAGAEGAAAAGAGGYFERLLGGKPPQEAVATWAKEFKVGVSEAWADLFGLNKQETGMKKHIYQQKPAGAEGGAGEGKEKGEGEEAEEGAEAAKPAGGGALVVVKQQQKTWERLAEQLKDAPIIQEILKAGTKLADTELGRQAGKLRGKLKDRVEDAREVWETSQNPLVYKLSSVWDDLTSETELGIALREIRRADPDFVLEDWVNTLSERFLPMFFKAYLKGDLKTLKPYLSEGMYKTIAEEFRLRKAEGLQLDPNVLEISNAEIVQAKMHDHQPVLVLGALIQHINCVRDREGKIVEGKEDDVRASFYLLLFVREYNEEEGALEWKVSERFLGFSQEFI